MRALCARIARNYVLNQWRAQAKAEEHGYVGLCEEPDEYFPLVPFFEERDPVDAERQLEVAADLFRQGKMPEHGYEILDGIAGGYSYPEVAEEAGISSFTLQGRLKAMRKRFREALEERDMLDGCDCSELVISRTCRAAEKLDRTFDSEIAFWCFYRYPPKTTAGRGTRRGRPARRSPRLEPRPETLTVWSRRPSVSSEPSPRLPRRLEVLRGSRPRHRATVTVSSSIENRCAGTSTVFGRSSTGCSRSRRRPMARSTRPDGRLEVIAGSRPRRAGTLERDEDRLGVVEATLEVVADTLGLLDPTSKGLEARCSVPARPVAKRSIIVDAPARRKRLLDNPVEVARQPLPSPGDIVALLEEPSRALSEPASVTSSPGEILPVPSSLPSLTKTLLARSGSRLDETVSFTTPTESDP